jgi:hypothetical protein
MSIVLFLVVVVSLPDGGFPHPERIAANMANPATSKVLRSSAQGAAIASRMQRDNEGFERFISRTPFLMGSRSFPALKFSECSCSDKPL